ncbi:MAG: sigma-70 family RNA polymerase sigma factor [Prevotella sp.]|nr:sigma-70 family RNA polymerase sigma factor [Prevotella sp.]
MDRLKFESIYRRYYTMMYRLAKTILYDADESKDVVSEVFTRLLRGRLYPDDDKIEGYLMTSVRNRCRDVINHKSVRERVEKLFLEEQKQDQRAYNINEDHKEEIQLFINSLPPLTQKIFRLRFLREMTYEEVALATGISKVTVYNHLSQSLQQMKKYFHNQQNDTP